MKITKYATIAASSFVLLLLLTTMAMAGDPNGSGTYTDDVAGLKIATNFAWTLIAASLVFFMQAGFALLGAGALRVKNTVNYFAKSYMDFSIGALAYWAVALPPCSEAPSSMRD
jgi:Amt family ammonium transporter